jgi:hypothetical protein
MSKPKAGEERRSKLEALNAAFRCAYIECPAHVIDDLKRRFDEYLAEVLVASALAAPQPSDLQRAMDYLINVYRFDGDNQKTLAAEFAQVRAEATDKVRALIAKWRDECLTILGHWSQAMNDCADELEAALGKET